MNTNSLYKKATRFLLAPYGVVVVTVLLSFGAWIFPSFNYFIKGFTDRENISFLAVGFFVSWYGLIVLFSYLGFHYPSSKRITIGGKPLYNLNNEKLYKGYTLLATVGLAFSFLLIIKQLGVVGIAFALITNSGNELKYALYENYSAGLPSLRYIAIITGGLAIFRIFKRGVGYLEVYNLILLFMSAMISSRLSFVCASMIGFTLIAYKGNLKKLDFRKLLKYGSLFFGAIIIMTFVRTYGTYSREGIENPIAAAFSEIITYLGAPFQVFIGLANNINRILSGQDYYYYIDVKRTLTTNSALEDLIYDIGLWSYPLMCVTAFVFAAGMKIALKNKDSFIFMFYPVALYAFAEIWRIYLFKTGLFQTLVLFTFVFPIGLKLFLHFYNIDFLKKSKSQGKKFILRKNE